jgi:hypothetical protein
MDNEERVEHERNMKKFKLDREKEVEELKRLLSFPANRYFFWRLLGYCNYFSSVSRDNPHDMAIASGRRDVGVWLMKELFEADPKAFTLMQREATEREQ